ncbi:uncharacterized protein LOC108115846 isoform X2 [Drosophila eugracilis]|uniref:uncharacterized protein LOC108115846 isoform X2 n=1 Tax=Drosophila eugracilis TaxID=29029 RepID=UPI001BD9EC0F|nr:uncharacterized protein LOC108115846 isoform X2 [Drosophila eugracilis]
MRFDLKDLLLMSMSISPNSVIRRHKRFKCGKVSFLVHYELQKGKLVIRQVKMIRHTPSLSSRLRKRLRLLQRVLKRESEISDGPERPLSQEDELIPTSFHHNSVAVGTDLAFDCTASQTPYQEWVSSQVDTCDLVETISRDQQTFSPLQQFSSIAVGTELEMDSSASQTLHQERITSQVDTSDLIHYICSDQQTFNPGQQTLSIQTDKKSLQSRAIQLEFSTKTSSTQIKLSTASLGTQIKHHFTNATVQTNIDTQDVNTQTYDVEEEIIKPHIQALYLIHDSIKNQSDLIHNEVLEAVNQLVDLTLLEVKNRRLERDLPREASLEPMTPIPSNQIGDNLPLEKLLSETEKNKLLGIKRNQETQTEFLEAKEVVSVEMATQTEKERSRWTLKRN